MAQAVVPLFAGWWGVAGLLIGAMEANQMQKRKPPPGLPPPFLLAIIIGEALFGFMVGLLIGSSILMQQVLHAVGK